MLSCKEDMVEAILDLRDISIGLAHVLADISVDKVNVI